MQIDFKIEEEWSEALVHRVLGAYRRSGSTDGRFEYGGLSWRIMSQREVRGQVFGVRLRTVPRVIKDKGSYEIFMYDFLVNPKLKPGRYVHETSGTAVGALTPMYSLDDKPMFRLKIKGETLGEVNALYELIVRIKIDPE